MVFRQCSIGGKAYRGDPELLDDEHDIDVKPPSISEPIRDGDPVSVDLWGISSTSTAMSRLDEGVNNNTNNRRQKPPEGDTAHFKDSVLQVDLEEALSDDLSPEATTHARSLNGFFTVLGLCHTVLASVDPVTGSIGYKAQSPDEAALVQAAADVGFIFRGKDREVLTLQTPSSPEGEKYELLNILDFTSARKRMSVVLRRLGEESDGRLFLLTKGADNVIFERLRAGAEELKDETERHLREFANGGLRTLTLAYKVLNGE